MQTPAKNNNGYKSKVINVTDSSDKSYIVCNIYNKRIENTQEANSDYTETTETLKDNYIPHNQFPKKSVMQKPTNYLYMDNDRSNPNPYPLSDNSRAQIYSKDKNIKPLNLNPYNNNKENNLQNIPPQYNQYNYQNNNLAQNARQFDPNLIVIKNQEEIIRAKIKKEEEIKKNMGCTICITIVVGLVFPPSLICLIPLLICDILKYRKRRTK